MIRLPRCIYTCDITHIISYIFKSFHAYTHDESRHDACTHHVYIRHVVLDMSIIGAKSMINPPHCIYTRYIILEHYAVLRHVCSRH